MSQQSPTDVPTYAARKDKTFNHFMCNLTQDFLLKALPTESIKWFSFNFEYIEYLVNL